MPRKGMRSLFLNHKTPPSLSPDHSSSATSRSPVSPSNIDLVIETASLIIDRWNPQEVTSLFRESKLEAMQLIKSVNNLQKSMVLLIADDPTSEKLVRAQKLMQIAMERLQKEFYQIQSMNRAYLHPESVSARSSLAFTRSSTSSFDVDVDGDESQDESRIGASIEEVGEASSAAMADLKVIANCMIANGYAKECVSIYRTIRKSIMDEAIFRLGIEKISSSQANKMDWEIVDRKMKNWLDAVKIAVKTLFHGEKILSDEVFASSPTIRESTFADITRDGAAILFGFPEIVTKIKKKSRQSEIIFRILDMYAAISENWQQIESIFSSESTTSVRLQALNCLVQLSEYIRPFLAEFENSLRKDSSKAIPPGGGVHSLTIEIMNHLSLLADYGSILGEILPPPEPSPDVTLPAADSPVTAFSRQLTSLIFVLLCKLDGKAKRYKNVSLSYLFLANNLQHVISKVHSSNLCYLLGNDWISEHERKIKQFAGNYERIAWGTVVASLPEISTIATMTPMTANEAIKRFYSSFSETCRKQRSCIVPEGNLRDQMKVSIARKIVPAYRELYDHSRKLMADHDHGNKNINSLSAVRFTPEDVANCLSDLFFGAIVSSGNSSGSPSSSSHRRQRRRLWFPMRFMFTAPFISNFISAFT